VKREPRDRGNEVGIHRSAINLRWVAEFRDLLRVYRSLNVDPVADHPYFHLLEFLFPALFERLHPGEISSLVGEVNNDAREIISENVLFQRQWRNPASVGSNDLLRHKS
jgi:hypothetical protein